MKNSFDSFTTSELSAPQLAKLLAGSCPCPGENDDSNDPSNGG